VNPYFNSRLKLIICVLEKTFNRWIHLYKHNNSFYFLLKLTIIIVYIYKILYYKYIISKNILFPYQKWWLSNTLITKMLENITVREKINKMNSFNVFNLIKNHVMCQLMIGLSHWWAKKSCPPMDCGIESICSPPVQWYK
jgi:hypothetical protein